MARNTGPSEAVKNIVVARADELCERCGSGLIVDIHHRRARGFGGTRDFAVNQPGNLVALCRPCHSHIESNRTEALLNGWLVSKLTVAYPREVPILLWRGWALLDDEGDWRACRDPN